LKQLEQLLKLNIKGAQEHFKNLQWLLSFFALSYRKTVNQSQYHVTFPLKEEGGNNKEIIIGGRREGYR
jgi:hypothetical protein